MKKTYIFIVLAVAIISVAAKAELQHRPYPGFDLHIDCDTRLAKLGRFELTKDTGNAKRPSSYSLDRNIPESCRQTSSRTYQSALKSQGITDVSIDVGHLVGANQMDSSVAAIKASMYMGNMVPQFSAFNRAKGAWYQTELLTECLREKTPLVVFVGTILGNDTGNDYFLESHGVKTPDYMFKIVYRSDLNRVQAFVSPNSPDTNATNLADYLVTAQGLSHSLDSIEVLDKLQDYLSAIDAHKPIPFDQELWEVKASGNKLNCEGTLADNS